MPRTGNVERVVWSRATDEEMIEAYRDGRADLLQLRGRPLDAAADWAPSELMLGPPAWLLCITFDFSDPAVSQPDVRRALAHALDRDQLTGSLEGVDGDPLMVATGGVVPPALQGHTPDIALRYDPDRARDLIVSTGTGRLSVVVPASPTHRLMIETVADCWDAVLPIEIERVEIDLETWRSRASFAHGPIEPFGWFPGYPDPEYFLRLLLHSDSHDIARDPRRRYRSPAFDALIEQTRQERDGARRLELFHSADRLAITEDVAMIPVYYGRSPYLVKPWVHGWWEFGKSWSSFADLEIEPVRAAR